MIIVLAIIVTFLAYANGANDNFKGVATLFGSGTASFKRAIGWATICTLAGSVCAVASRIGMPVSTTHVSCGTLFGIGAVNGTARWRIILSIFGAWLVTLPIGAVMGAISWSVVRVFYG